MSKFLLKVKVGGCEEVFNEEMGPGILATQGVELDTDDPVETAIALMSVGKTLLATCVHVEVERVEG